MNVNRVTWEAKFIFPNEVKPNDDSRYRFESDFVDNHFVIETYNKRIIEEPNNLS